MERIFRFIIILLLICAFCCQVGTCFASVRNEQINYDVPVMPVDLNDIPQLLSDMCSRFIMSCFIGISYLQDLIDPLTPGGDKSPRDIPKDFINQYKRRTNI